LLQTGILATNGFKEQALQHLEFVSQFPATGHITFGMPRIHAWILEHQHYWDIETDTLRKTLIQELKE
jgi:hypothetical protein